MSLLTDSSVAALATDPSVSNRASQTEESSLPTAIFPSSASRISTGSNSQVTTSPTTLSSSFYSNLEILTDTSSIAALASSGSISNTSHKSASSNDNGSLEDEGSNKGGSSSSSSVASVNHNQKSDTSGGSSIHYKYQQDKMNWKLIGIPLLLVLPLVL